MSKKIIGFLLVLLNITFSSAAFSAGQVKVYSAREAKLIQPLFDQFTEKTGIKVELVTGEPEQLLERLKTERGDTAADLFLAADTVHLQRAKNADLLQSVTSKTLNTAIPSVYRDKDRFWYGLTMFVRPIFYVKSDTDPYQFYGYEEMAKPEWEGRICVSSSDNIFNQTLVASMIAKRGKKATQEWLSKFVANFARPAHGNDRDQLIAVADGKCDITLANTYLYGQMFASEDKAEQQVVADFGMIWANQPSRGVHANFSGAGITAQAPHKGNAKKLLEFLLTEESQTWFMNNNYEYPTVDMKWPYTLTRWGRFKSDSTNMPRLEELNETAVTFMKEAGWQ